MRIGTLVFLCACGFGLSQSIEFKGTLKLTPEWTNIRTDGSSVVIETFASIVESAHTTGTNANQMTSFSRSVGTLTNSADVVLDLRGGVRNSFGDTLTFTRVNFLCVTAAATNGSAIAVGGASGAAFEAWGTNAVVRPGGTVMYHAPDIVGYAVGTNGNLRIANTGTNAVSYAVYIGGIQ